MLEINMQMRMTELRKPSPKITSMSVMERHMWATFLYKWLSGDYMSGFSKDVPEKWRIFAKIFPPKQNDRNLFRLVTVPVRYAKQTEITFKPAPNSISSWTRTLTGLDAVAGIAQEMSGIESKTARIGIEARINGKSILATPITIRDAFMDLTYDYDKYFINSGEDHPDWPGDNRFDMGDVYFLQDVLNRTGGHYRQYEYVVETPPRVTATVVQIYRIGTNEIRLGNDDPHHFDKGQRAPRITRMKSG